MSLIRNVLAASFACLFDYDSGPTTSCQFEPPLERRLRVSEMRKAKYQIGTLPFLFYQIKLGVMRVFLIAASAPVGSSTTSNKEKF